MIFRTELPKQESLDKISYDSKILLMGSCFANEIGGLLEKYNFDALVNPLGTIYNPLILCKLLMHTIDNRKYTPSDLLNDNGVFFHNDIHSQFNSTSSEKFLKKISDTQEKLRFFIQNADFIFLTLGTSIGHLEIKSNQLVGNCHKRPSSEFKKHKIAISEITQALRQLQSSVININPKVKIIFTVSPVRHTKSGIEENSKSKARLISAIDELTLQENEFGYFPAYELMIDDLRDYRFYKADLIHPNDQAVEYIWNYFQEMYLSDSTKITKSKIHKILTALAHKPFNPGSEKHQNFVKQTKKQIVEIETKLGRAFNY